LQPLPKQPRLPDPPNFVPPRDHPLLAILHHELAQRVHQVRPQVLEPLVVRPQRKLRQRFLHIRRRLLAVDPERRTRGAGIDSAGCGRTIERRNETVVRCLVLTVQDGQVSRICLLICHVFQ
jgi:hypothetical protein